MSVDVLVVAVVCPGNGIVWTPAAVVSVTAGRATTFVGDLVGVVVEVPVWTGARAGGGSVAAVVVVAAAVVGGGGIA